MEVCRLEVLLQYMKRDINKLILLYYYYYTCRGIFPAILIDVGCLIFGEFVCCTPYTLNFAFFHLKQTDLSSTWDNLARYPKF